MNGAEGLRFTTPRQRQTVTNDGYEGLRFTAPRQRAPERDPLGDLSSWHDLTRKSLLKGAVSIADLPANLLNLVERGGRSAIGYLGEKAGIPNNIDNGAENDFFSPENVDRPSKWLDAGANKLGLDLAPRPRNAPERIASNAAEFAGAFGPFGLASKGSKALSMANQAKTGAVIGGTSGALQEGGVNPLVADLASIVAAPTVAAKLNPRNLYEGFKKIPQTAAKIPLKIMGLSPKGLNIEAAQAARDLGIDLPAAALTESKLTGLADQFVGKTPYFGNKLGKKYLNAENQIKDALNKIYEEIGPEQSDELLAKINQLYDRHKKLLPADAREIPSNLVESAKKIKSGAAAKDEDLAKLLKYKNDVINEFNPSPSKQFGSLITPYGEIKGLPVPDTLIQSLIDQKKAFNNILWNKGKPREIPADFKGAVDSMRIGANKDVAKYGEKNPEWYKSFKEADELYGKAANRATLEELLGKSTNAATDNLSYNALSKAINSKKTNARIKTQVAPETFEKIKRLGTIAKAMAVKNRNVPNPSGTAITTAIGGYLGAFYTPEAVTALVGTAGLTKLLTDKKLLDLALKYAEKPNVVNVIPFNKRIKDITGYSAIALNKELQREQERKGQ